MKMKTQPSRTMGHSEGRAKGKVYSYECLHKSTERSQKNDLMLHLKLLEKQEQAKSKTNRREIIKKDEINETEKKKYTKYQQIKKLVLQKDK
jgi:hypothetical protein